MHDFGRCEYLKLRNVSKKFPGQSTPAVANLSFSLEYGEILSLLGPSGCGKTTTLRLIAGFERHYEGQICLAGRTVSDTDFSIPPEKRNVGIVFQEYALFPHLTVWENVRFSFTSQARKRSDAIESILRLVDLHTLRDRYPHELSGGQQQRLALARALAPRPKILLLDEPFSNLDADLREQMRNEVKNILHATETTTVFVTHDQEEAFAFSDKVGVLQNGRLEQFDTPEKIYHTPVTRFIADFVGQADFIPGVIVQPGVVETDLGLFPSYSRVPEGAPVEVMIRPDDVQILPGSDQTNGVIIHRTFRGSINGYTVQLDAGPVLHSDQPSTMLYQKGTRVRVQLGVEHVVVFPRTKNETDRSESYTPDVDITLRGVTQRSAV
jgi:iron(III) transport system ATP-binding protein